MGHGLRLLGMAVALGAAGSGFAQEPERAVPEDRPDGHPLPEAEVLPRSVLFDPLIADPRWPHYSASWHNYGGRAGLDDVGAVSLGDGFGFYQAPLDGGTWGIGLQAAVFAVFDLDAPSKDLVNADYWVGVPLTWRRNGTSLMVRASHMSSHLGDEFLLRNSVGRVNLSYEAVDLTVSQYLFGDLVRLYAGGGFLFDQEPKTLAPGRSQAGLELRGPRFGRIRPVAGVDLRATEESGWEADTSVRAGVQVESRADRNYIFQMTLDYYHGRNPNGQFYTEPAEFWGIGTHVFF